MFFSLLSVFSFWALAASFSALATASAALAASFAACALNFSACALSLAACAFSLSAFAEVSVALAEAFRVRDSAFNCFVRSWLVFTEDKDFAMLVTCFFNCSRFATAFVVFTSRMICAISLSS